MKVAQWLRIHQTMQETRVQSLGREDPLEEEMATHPVFLPGESHGQRSLASYSLWGFKRIGHNLATKQQKICGWRDGRINGFEEYLGSKINRLEWIIGCHPKMKRVTLRVPPGESPVSWGTVSLMVQNEMERFQITKQTCTPGQWMGESGTHKKDRPRVWS